MAKDVLPDSRMHNRTGVVRHATLGNQVPVFCANCGKPGGYVPAEWMTHCFYMCQPCADSGLGKMAHDLYEEPDEVWRRRAAEARRRLSPVEVAVQLDDPSTTLAKLAAEWRAHVLRTTI